MHWNFYKIIEEFGNMSSFIIYKQDAIAKKLDPDSASADKEGFVTHIHGLKVNIQPASPEMIALNPIGETGKLYRGFTTRSGIREGMMIVTSGSLTVSGMRYRVTGVEEWRGPLGTTFNLILYQSNE